MPETKRLENLQLALGRILSLPGTLPADWEAEATTYDLPRFCEEAEFIRRFEAASERIADQDIQAPAQLQSLLADCGHPYDYARLGQPLSSVYELYLQHLSGAAKVISFASQTKPYLAIIEAQEADQPVALYTLGRLPLSDSKKADLIAQNVEIHEHWQGPLPVASKALRVVVHEQPWSATEQLEADAHCYPLAEGGLLLINSPRIDPQRIQLIRKRTVAALLAANAKAELQRLLGLDVPEISRPAVSKAACQQLLTELFPEVRESLYFCTGLAAEAAVFSASAQLLAQTSGQHPVRLFYAQNGYGGTSQLIAEILPKTGLIEAVPLPVLGQDASGRPFTLIDRLIKSLNALQGAPALIFLETPTNPELQVHDFGQLMQALKAYQANYGLQIPVLVDTTLAPLYPLFAQDFAQDWPFLIVKSGSKYFTKGKATLGVVFCAENALAQHILARARDFGQDADTFAKSSQLRALASGLQDLRPRMARIAANTRQLAEALQQSFQALGHKITLYTISDAQLEAGLASGILSFYLPAAPTLYPDLVDEFVDYLLSHAPDLVRNRVSYGQSSSGAGPDMFYVINPQESTQGSLSAEVKAAQKKDNVQICRVSVPEHADVEGLMAVMNEFFSLKYH